MLKKLKLQWLFNRSIALFFVSLLGLMMVAVVINMLGIRVIGTVESWQRYLTENARYFLVWRVVLYSLMLVGWLWVKKRLMVREEKEDEQSMTSFKQRLLRIELATAIAFVVLEVSNGLGR